MITGVVDGNYLLHRCMHVKELSELKTTGGIKTGGVVGFLNSLSNFIADLCLDKCLVVFDGGISKRRREIYPLYKGNSNRDKTDQLYVEPDEEKKQYIEDLKYQSGVIRDFLPNFGVRCLRIPGFEADDIIFNICRKHLSGLVYAISDDRDYFQILSEVENVSCRLFRPMANEVIFKDSFERLMGYPLDHFLLNKSICGDSSDKIPGVEGTGSVTAVSALAEIGSVGDYPFTEFFDKCSKHKSKRVRNIAEQKDVVLRNYNLVDISREQLPDDVHLQLSEFVKSPVKCDLSKSLETLQLLEMNKILEKLESFVVPFQRLR